MSKRQIRAVVYAKTDGHCWYCGIPLPPFGDWQIEHQLPRSRGGGDEPYNLVASCRSCNTAKGIRTVAEYRRTLLARAVSPIPMFYGREVASRLFQELWNRAAPSRESAI